MQTSLFFTAITTIVNSRCVSQESCCRCTFSQRMKHNVLPICALESLSRYATRTSWHGSRVDRVYIAEVARVDNASIITQSVALSRLADGVPHGSRESVYYQAASTLAPGREALYSVKKRKYLKVSAHSTGCSRGDEGQRTTERVQLFVPSRQIFCPIPPTDKQRDQKVCTCITRGWF